MSTDVDAGRRRFLTASISVVGGVGAVVAAVPFVVAWQPSARARAIGAPIEIDISKIEPGMMITRKWRGKPVWVLRRTEKALETLPLVEEDLRDPNSDAPQQPLYAKNEYRSIKPEYLVLLGVCTHLGCAPKYYPLGTGQDLGAEFYGGFFCPCHGSRFDMAGRVYQGVPAPSNLEVPPYMFASESIIVVGEDKETT